MDEIPTRLDDLIQFVRRQHPDGGPLDNLADAVLTAERLGEVADHLIGHFVDQARRAGASWTDIGQYMGVSKQAAQKRFVPKKESLGDGAFSRFTQRARHAIVQAQEEARGAGHDYIGTEHILLGLLHEPDALAARAMAEQGAPPDRVRAAVTAALGPAVETPPSGHIPFTPRAKKVRELAVRTALRLGHDYIGTEHVLLALFEEGEGVAAQVLAGLGVDGNAAEEWILAALAEDAGE
jgi:hypothetical protein